MSRPPHPTFINLPQPPSQPDTPSEMPGTPTSTTTSLSALSTTAIKDGHRGHALPTTGHRGHHHHASTNSLEAERADRISRLTGLSGVNTLRHAEQAGATGSARPTPTSPPAPAFFDSNGQPTATTRISTVGTASATESVGGRTLAEGDEDLMSLGTNPLDAEADSVSGYTGGGAGDVDQVDEDLTSRSAGGFDDGMSDDGNASLVGFGEGAGSTVSGPIYHRRPVPPGGSGLERSSSGFSDSAARREPPRLGGVEREAFEAPAGGSVMLEQRAAYVPDGAGDGAGAGEGMLVDAAMIRGPGPLRSTAGVVGDAQLPAPISHQQRWQSQTPRQQQLQPPTRQQPAPATSREAMERIVSGLDDGEGRMGATALSSPGKGGGLGRFYFEDSK